MARGTPVPKRKPLFWAQAASKPRSPGEAPLRMRSPSPFRRSAGVVHGRAPDAALHHCNMDGEDVAQLHFSSAPLQNAWTVRLTL